MASDVKVKIDLTKPVGRLGFGFPLILSIGAAKDYAECSTLEAVVTAGFEASTDTYKAAALMFSQNHPPAKIAVAGAASADTAVTTLTGIASNGWRQLVIVGAQSTNYSAVATYVNTLPDKMLFCTVSDDSGLTDLGSGDKTVGFVHSNSLAAAALAGEAAGMDPGSFTYKNLILSGIDPMSLSDADIEDIHDANGITFITKAGDNVTSEGKAMSGEYIDIIDSKDYIIQQIEYATQKMLNTADKVPYDNNGIAMLESAAVNVMKDAYEKGIIATGEDGKPAYSVSYALREETDENDRAERKYFGGQFSFELAGAVHYVEITGEIII